MKSFNLQNFASLLLVVPLSAVLLQGCAEMTTAGTAVDRRTVGTMVEDEGIELRATNRVSERFGDKVHVNITSYNRSVLVTGEVPNTPTKVEIEKLVQAVPSVRGITNELQVIDATSVTSRATDTTITGKVKARLFDSGKLNALHVKVITEAGVVYLLGIVTEGEANAAAEVARTTGGVRKVVKVFDYCKPTEAICARGGKPEEPKKAGS
jgi:osmotically-inducible protein OsmY